MVTSIDLLDVRILPCAFMKDTLLMSWKALIEGAEKKEGKVTFAFKVLGENRLVVVLTGGTESATEFLNAAYGNTTTTECTPLRKFENFAADVLQCDTKKLSCIPIQDLQNLEGELFWLKLTYDYQGMPIKKFFESWKEECEFWLKLKSQQYINLELFKVVGQNEVHMFMRIESADLLDDLLFTSPIIKSLGSRVKIVVKSIIFVRDLTGSKY